MKAENMNHNSEAASQAEVSQVETHQAASQAEVSQVETHLDRLMTPTAITTVSKSLIAEAQELFVRRQSQKLRAFHKSAILGALMLEQAEANNPLAVQYLEMETRRK